MTTSAAGLESRVLDATLRFLDAVSGHVSREKIYGFVFYFPAEENYLAAAIGTEERLLDTAREYYSKGYTSPDQDPVAVLAEYLRWSAAEDGWLSSVGSRTFDPVDELLLSQLTSDELELFGGHLVEATRQVLLNEVFELRLSEMTRGRDIPKLRAYDGAFLIPEVVHWAEETNTDEILKSFRAEVERSCDLCSRIFSPRST